MHKHNKMFSVLPEQRKVIKICVQLSKTPMQPVSKQYVKSYLRICVLLLYNI